MTYLDELVKSMKFLSKNNKTIFLGQSVAYSGSIMSKSLESIPISKRIELPLIEDAQMGMSIGLALEGFIPVSIYPRIDFLIIAANQLINHLDKIEEMSCGQYSPKVVIRTALGSTRPLYPGIQHCSDYTNGLKAMLKNVNVVSLTKSDQILPAYMKALDTENHKSTILIEKADLYSTE